MPAFSPSRLQAILERLPPARRWWIGYSGGCDSSVLLHALAQIRPPGIALQALHVNHQLHPEADAWAEHCRHIANTLAIPFREIRVNAAPAPGESPEAAARAARYAAFADTLEAGDLLLLAHHRDDQAETLLLRLLRGAGPDGLAAMPASRPLGRGRLARPLLGFSRDDLRTWAREAGLDWIEDPANFDTGPDRNFLRHEILPRLRERWPGVDESLVRAAELQRDAADQLATQAAQDWQESGSPAPERLDIERLTALPRNRQQGLLRHWIGRVNGLPVPDRRHLQRILDEVVPAARDASPEVRWPGGRVRRHAGCLWLDGGEGAPVMQALPWDLNAACRLPDGRILVARRARGQGLRADLQGRTDIRIGFRRGGERLRPAGRGPHRHRLKKLLQEWQVPPWERSGLPLLFIGDDIAAVPGYCVCEPYVAGEGEDGLILELASATPD